MPDKKEKDELKEVSKELDQLIRVLESLRYSDDTPDQEKQQLIPVLSLLYRQRLVLVERAINNNTAKYGAATKELKKAAAQAKKATNNLGKLDSVINNVAKVIAKVTKILQ